MPEGRSSSVSFNETPDYLAGEDDIGDLYAERPMGPRFITHDPEFGSMTLSRRIARFLSRYKWYYPERDNPNVCLDEAWHFFERVTLPRYFSDEKSKKTSGYDRAAQGETKRATSLYPVLKTPQEELADFGLGAGLYFAMARALSIILLIGGLVNSSSFAYYQSDKYITYEGDIDETYYILGNCDWSGDSVCENGTVAKTTEYIGKYIQDGLFGFLLKGSAICPTSVYVPCYECLMSEGNYYMKESFNDRRLSITTPETTYYFLKKNNCKTNDMEHGILTFVSMVFVIFAVILLGKYMLLAETRFDENEQTAQDYSIIVRNPPSDVTDPDKYRNYFQELTGHHVTVVTIGLNNFKLISKLTERRRLLHDLHFRRVERSGFTKLVEFKFHDLGLNTKQKFFGKAHAKKKDSQKITEFTGIVELDFSETFTDEDIEQEENPGNRKLMAKIVKLEAIIRELYEEDYKAVKVFVTFETELGQRTAIESLQRAHDIERTKEEGDTSTDVLKFYDILPRLDEPVEPSAIRWQDMGVPVRTKFTQRIVSTFIVMNLIGLVVWATSEINKKYKPLASFFVSAMNVVIPFLCRIINYQEAHSTEGGAQAFLYSKITAVRWVNTAILFTFITPFQQTLDQTGLLTSIVLLFMSEAITAPFLSFLDLASNFKKHLKAPRCKSQIAMNNCFRGTPYFLAERYTDVTKVLFVTCFYSVLLPAGYLLGSATLMIYYLSDKFAIMRTWAPAPALGSQLSRWSRAFFLLSIICMAVLSAYWWSGFPFDDLCEVSAQDQKKFKEAVLDPLAESMNATEFISTSIFDTKDKEVTELDEVVIQLNGHTFCDQDYLRNFWFPPSTFLYKDNWMQKNQKIFVELFGWISVACICVVTYILVGKKVLAMAQNPEDTLNDTKNQFIDFTCVPEIYAYIPQVIDEYFQYPLLACDLDNIDDNLIYWEDGERSYDYWNMIYDVPGWAPHKSDQRLSRVSGTIPDNIESVSTFGNKSPVFSVVAHYPPWHREE